MMRFIKFCIVGCSNTVISLIVYFGALSCGVNYIVATITGYVLSSAWGYVVNKLWVFKPKRNIIWKSVVKYYITYGVALGINVVGMYCFVDIACISEKIAPFIILCITIPLNFCMSKFWIYKEDKR